MLAHNARNAALRKIRSTTDIRFPVGVGSG
jgi:hypothetical protein